MVLMFSFMHPVSHLAKVWMKVGVQTFVDMHYTVQVDSTGSLAAEGTIPCSRENDHNFDQCVYQKGIIPLHQLFISLTGLSFGTLTQI